MSWWNEAWGNRFRYDIPNASLPDGESLTDYPLHIPLTTEAPAGFWAHVKVDGADIRIVASDDETQLEDCHLEGWDQANSKGHLWVKDTIPEDTGTNTHWVYVYYNNAAAAADWDKSATYNADYGGVYHLDETSGHHLDATANGRDSTAETLEQQGADIGQIDGADEFEPEDGVTIPATSLSVSAGTIVALAKTTADTASAAYVYQHVKSGPTNRIYLFQKSARSFVVRLGSTGDQDTGEDFVLGTVHAVGLTWDGTTGRAYFDGAEVHDWEYVGLTALDPSAYIGNTKVYDHGWEGILDEVRISQVRRSAEWMEFACLSDKGNAGTGGAEETLALPRYPAVVFQNPAIL